MTPHEFQQELSKHDWFYIFADDRRSYERGKTNEQKLLHIAMSSPELLNLYKQELRNQFNNHTS